jgi:hypothetical protein
MVREPHHDTLSKYLCKKIDLPNRHGDNTNKGVKDGEDPSLRLKADDKRIFKHLTDAAQTIG